MVVTPTIMTMSTALVVFEADTPARYNADPDRLFESSGCAGKLAVFAVRLIPFEAEKNQQVFYIGTNQPEVLTEIRRPG